MTYSEYLFPNDMHIYWSLMIVTYPFITGLIAGAFIASALYHVFGLKELEPISLASEEAQEMLRIPDAAPGASPWERGE